MEVDQTSFNFLSRYVVRFCIACTLSIIVLVLLFIKIYPLRTNIIKLVYGSC
ncbi:unnamed protein product [Arabidopsis halleri]